MAVNQQRGLVQIASQLSGRAQIATGNGQLPSTGSVEALNSVAGDLSRIGNEIGRYADHAAAVEGEREGRLAGMDPEFRPSRALTIRGEAYDRAGLQVAASQTRIAVEEEIDKGGDLEGKRQAWLGKVAEELRPEVDHMFRRGIVAQSRQAAREHAARVAAEVRASVQTDVEQGLKGLHQRAYALGLDPTADDLLAKDMGLLAKHLARTTQDGKRVVSPEAAAKLLSQAREEVSNARLLGAFGRLDGIAAKEAFLKEVDEDYRNGRGLAKEYDFDGFQRITGTLEGELRSAKAEAGAASRGLMEEIKGVQRLAEKGYAPPADQLAGLRGRVAVTGSGDLALALAEAEDLAQWQASARRARPEELDTFARAERSRMRDGADPRTVARVEMAEKLADEARRELKQDPLGWADRSGVLKIAPLDLSSPDATAVSLQARVAQAETVAAEYGVPAQYLRPDERLRLATAAAQGGEATIAIAEALTRAGGDKAPAILGELFAEAPTVAVLGGHVAEAGVTAAARDAADGMALAKTKEFKSVAPEPQKARAALAEEIGTALAALPKSEQAVLAMANAAYEVRARRLGVTEFDDALWRKTLREALGERQVGGETYGGVVYQGAGYISRGDTPVVIPPDVKQDGFGELVEAIRLDDLTATGGAPLHGDGSPASIASVRRARLVSAGAARYLLALGDPLEDPQYLMDGRGQPYVLDLGKLAPTLRKRRPDLYLGGR